MTTAERLPRKYRQVLDALHAAGCTEGPPQSWGDPWYTIDRGTVPGAEYLHIKSKTGTDTWHVEWQRTPGANWRLHDVWRDLNPEGTTRYGYTVWDLLDHLDAAKLDEADR